MGDLSRGNAPGIPRDGKQPDGNVRRGLSRGVFLDQVNTDKQTVFDQLRYWLGQWPVELKSNRNRCIAEYALYAGIEVVCLGIVVPRQSERSTIERA